MFTFEEGVVLSPFIHSQKKAKKKDTKICRFPQEKRKFEVVASGHHKERAKNGKLEHFWKPRKILSEMTHSSLLQGF